MAVLFSGNAGKVKVVQLGDGVQAATITIKVGVKEAGLVGTAGVLILGISEDQQVSAQMVTSLEKDVYIYSFGDQIGDLTLSGLLLDSMCVTPSAHRRLEHNRWIGIRTLTDFYKRARAIEEDRVVTVTLGKRVISGYLMRMGHSTANPELKTQSFILNIKTLPDA
jgi:hypothetical protein